MDEAGVGDLESAISRPNPNQRGATQITTSVVGSRSEMRRGALSAARRCIQLLRPRLPSTLPPCTRLSHSNIKPLRSRRIPLFLITHEFLPEALEVEVPVQVQVDLEGVDQRPDLDSLGPFHGFGVGL